jgi:hypothetical protein
MAMQEPELALRILTNIAELALKNDPLIGIRRGRIFFGR